MMYDCVLDIETIPAQTEEARAEVIANLSPPANYKDQAKIDEWLASKADEAVAKTSFDPARGHICTIGWAIDDGEAVAAHATTVGQERDILQTFFGQLQTFQHYTFIGHNLVGFDLRFILCRAVVLGVEIPKCIPRDPKPWDKNTFDTMLAWSGSRGTISMDNLCKALGIEGKGDFDGSMVAGAWANGEHEKIADYCRADVDTTRQVYRRFKSVGF